MADVNCHGNGKRRTSTLPPQCYHCRPPPFCCPKDGCPPVEPCLPPTRCPPPCLPLIWRLPPESPKPPPTICIARPCPQRPGPVPFQCPPKKKIQIPPSTIRFAIQHTCQGSTYHPCYSPGVPKCHNKDCC